MPKAVALAKKVADALSGSKPEAEPKKDPEPTQRSAQTPSEAPVIDCQGCSQKLRIKLGSESHEYSCPSCKSKFHASFSGGVLSVVFVKSSGNGADSRDDDTPLTVKDAYKLFEADESSSWETIELSRRRLIQQYHPDKVAALGPKLKMVAEAEGKRINVAYDLLRKAKGY
ncbi:DnaJ-like protein DjlA [mine drainage metagenome]|uniref:DnaJ-like protein DjlA n=1 Tax=mine drainage metagenome TaxID=410659 RepID=A0A1J5PQM3_9ZZZZ